MEFVLLIALPALGALTLAFLGARRQAPEINSAFSLGTFLAACGLTVRVISEGNLTLAREQFFIDPFNVFLVALTAFIGWTTSLFSRPTCASSASTGGCRRASCGCSTACTSCSSPPCSSR